MITKNTLVFSTSNGISTSINHAVVNSMGFVTVYKTTKDIFECKKVESNPMELHSKTMDLKKVTCLKIEPNLIPSWAYNSDPYANMCEDFVSDIAVCQEFDDRIYYLLTHHQSRVFEFDVKYVELNIKHFSKKILHQLQNRCKIIRSFVLKEIKLRCCYLQQPEILNLLLLHSTHIYKPLVLKSTFGVVSATLPKHSSKINSVNLQKFDTYRWISDLKVFYMSYKFEQQWRTKFVEDEEDLNGNDCIFEFEE